MLFGTGKLIMEINLGSQLMALPSTPQQVTSTLVYIWTRYLILILIFHKMYKKAAGRVNLLWRIGSSVDT